MSNTASVDLYEPSSLSLLEASPFEELYDSEFATYLDTLPLALSELKCQFSYPTHASLATQSSGNVNYKEESGEQVKEKAIYFCGNSLGLMPKSVPTLIQDELATWSNLGVLGHFSHPLSVRVSKADNSLHDRQGTNRNWKNIDYLCTKQLSHIIGSKQTECAIMGTLTSNLHTLLDAFYVPSTTTGRIKIVFEEKAFPSDLYAFESQVRLRGLDPQECLLPLKPRQGEYTLRTSDIVQTLRQHGSQIALVMLSGIQYYTGQCFDMKEITRVTHEIGALSGWDLAHAVGNVELQLHAWGVDFAVWCSYKYLCSGPGGIAGIFVREDVETHALLQQARKTSTIAHMPRQAGWWGHKISTRFDMPSQFDPIPGAAGFQLSNPSVLNMISLYGSLEIFDQVRSTGGLAQLRQKSVLMTEYLELLLLTPEEELSGTITLPNSKTPKNSDKARLEIITPKNKKERGAQLSVLFHPLGCGVMEHVMTALLKAGIIADERQPDVIRLAPVPMYNGFEECFRVANAVKKAVSEWVPGQAKNDANKMQITT